jgi:hypothetical protein
MWAGLRSTGTLHPISAVSTSAEGLIASSKSGAAFKVRKMERGAEASPVPPIFQTTTVILPVVAKQSKTRNLVASSSAGLCIFCKVWAALMAASYSTA